MKQIIVVGCGGHAKVVIDLVRARGDHDLAGVVAHDGEVSTLADIPLLGSDQDLPKLRQQGLGDAS